VQTYTTSEKLVLHINSSFVVLAVPVYFWPLLKTTAGQTRGTDHAKPHGHVRQVQGGIELNGVDAWLDGGDFHGKCFSDPDLCIKGLSVAMQVCFNFIILLMFIYMFDSSVSSKSSFWARDKDYYALPPSRFQC
jgi:hypothetical protein